MSFQKRDFTRPIALARRSINLLPKRTKSTLQQFEASILDPTFTKKWQGANTQRKERETRNKEREFRNKEQARREEEIRVEEKIFRDWQNSYIIAAARRETARRERYEKILKQNEEYEEYMRIRKQAPTTNLDNIPAKVMSLIFNELNNNEVVCLSLTCKDIRAMYDEFIHINDGLCYHGWNGESPSLMTLLAGWFPREYTPCLQKQKFLLKDHPWVEMCPCLECTLLTGRVWGKVGVPRCVYLQFEDGKEERLSVYAARF